MTIAWSASHLEAVIYLMCVATSLLCAYLLARAYRRGRTKLLIWSEPELASNPERPVLAR